MMRNSQILLILACLLTLPWAVNASTSAAPVAQRVIQHGFPTQPRALANTTEALFTEYHQNHNALSLVFYAYGVLRQADHFMTVNDVIRASEYAKTGFFYLDEAVERHEDNLQVRYLRARLDAWLAADLGRCVITLKDTAELLNHAQAFNAPLVKRIEGMRYRALLNCHYPQQADALLAQIKSQDPGATAAWVSDRAPEWDMNEVTQVMLPLLKGK
ncbi:hypothetical protein SAMN05216516_10482 [Izhakiella capsodis]|uniref:Sel1 repeat family protein n=1 Tax=Izhakiella capsodis TaxID=1367852 RepID=A0A1I4XDT5_9GAMM|nr:hypothetical protein [Izhakiella capsodis]SFN24078.1 hypothetical protein SAMN05216516_10482 [Izhakiella capsodis]